MVNTQDAKQLRSKINIRSKIENLGDIRTVNLKVGGTVNVRDAELVDEAGSIKITLWGDETTLFQAGDMIELVNGYSNEYRGTVSLAKGKFGTLTKVN